MKRTIDCPNCGAPLCQGSAAAARGDLWPCLYCNALVRVSQPSDRPDYSAEMGPTLTVEREIPAEVMARVRAEILAGRRNEAVAICEREAGVSHEVAEAAVGAMFDQVALKVLSSQPLSMLGLVIFALAVTALAAGIALPLLHKLPWWAGGTLIGLAILHLLVLKNGLVTTLRFSSAPLGDALVHSVIHIGGRQLGKQKVELFALAVEVQPRNGRASFRGRLTVPVRSQNAHKIHVGAKLPVRYHADDPEWLRFDRDALARS